MSVRASPKGGVSYIYIYMNERFNDEKDYRREYQRRESKIEDMEKGESIRGMSLGR